LIKELKISSVNKIAYYAYTDSRISQNKEQTKINKIWSVKKILFVIGLLKKYLGASNESLYNKINLENKLIRVLLKLDEIVIEYNLDYDNLKENLFLNSVDFLKIINDNNIKSYIGTKTVLNLSSGLIKKLESINLLESNIDNKNLQILDIYLSLLFVNKVFTNYNDIIDQSTNKKLFINI
jgi:hypothetical protein